MGEERRGRGETEIEILKILAEEGMQWYYDLAFKRRLASNKTVISALRRLEKEGLIEVKRVEGQRKYYGLTFRGLLKAIELGLIDLNKAHEVRINHGIEIPRHISIKAREADLIKLIEANAPGVFYRMLSWFYEVARSFPGWEKYVEFAAALVTLYLLAHHSDYLALYAKGDDLYFPDGSCIKDWLKGVQNFKNTFQKDAATSFFLSILFGDNAESIVKELLFPADLIKHIIVKDGKVYWKE